VRRNGRCDMAFMCPSSFVRDRSPMPMDQKSRLNVVVIGALVLLWALSPLLHACTWLCDATVARAFKDLAPGGLRVTYYRGLDFEKRVCTRSERSVEKDYGSGRPARKVPKDNFSARWDGLLVVPMTARYSFYVQSDDGARLIIDDTLVIDYWENGRWTPGKYGETDLAKGTHKIRIEHCDRGDEAAIRLSWRGGEIRRETVLAVPYLRKEPAK
jgi:hypothetical protein